MALLVAGRAVCGSAAARLANMGSVDDPASCRQLCMRTNAPSRDGRKPHEARRRTGPDPSEAGHDPGGARETSPGSWPGPSCDSSPLRGPIASPMGWTVTPPAGHRPTEARRLPGRCDRQTGARRRAVRLVAAAGVSGHRQSPPAPAVGGCGRPESRRSAGRRLGRLTRWLASCRLRSARRMIAHARVVGRRGWLSLYNSTTTLAPRMAYCSSRRTHRYNSAADHSRAGSTPGLSATETGSRSAWPAARCAGGRPWGCGRHVQPVAGEGLA
jgi:hypothetical protein